MFRKTLLAGLMALSLVAVSGCEKKAEEAGETGAATETTEMATDSETTSEAASGADMNTQSATGEAEAPADHDHAAGTPEHSHDGEDGAHGEKKDH
ncbi:MAG: hypothetical protein VKP57_12075 [Candidatus Sericytochromatia bacterium]|nr:hypothetical protein [Candidatus Sericytochromatia bacterium]